MSFGVDSLHINVEYGDAALHLLVWNKASKRSVKSAVLVDGGKGNPTNMVALRDTIDFAKQNYEWDSSKLLLDAVVVTHWDSDHYQGICELLEEEIASWDGHGNYRPTLFKFDANNNYQPMTRFYCPNWNTTPVIKFGKGKQKGHPPVFTKVHQDSKDYLAINAKGNSYAIAQLITTKILGAELFYGLSLEEGQAQSITTPLALVKAYQAHPQISGLYCVAAWGICLGQVSAREQEAASTEGDEPGIIDANEVPTKANNSSIACMVIWGNGQLSHYIGGDLGDELEQDIVSWTKTNGSAGLPANPDKDGFNWVTSMKASHHGSHTSTPATMLKSFYPENIVVSPSADYGHPRYEFIFYLLLFNALSSLRPAPGDFRTLQQPLYSTIYPYWFAQKVENGERQFVIPAWNKVSTKVFDHQEAVYDNYHDELMDLVQQINSIRPWTLEDPFQTWSQKGSRLLKLGWVASVLSSEWSRISMINATCYPSQSSDAKYGAFYGSNVRTAGRRNESLTFILIESRQPYYQDGSVWTKQQGYPCEQVKDNSGRSAEPIIHPTAPITPKWLKLTTEPFYIPWPGLTSNLPNDFAVHITDDSFWENENDPDEMSEWCDNSSGQSGPSLARVLPHRPIVSIPAYGLDPGYYLLSKRSSMPSPTPPGVTAVSIDSTDMSLLTFVSSLNTGLIGLAQKPNSSPVQFIDDDEWFLWWKQLGFTSLAATGTPESIKALTTDLNVVNARLNFDTDSIAIVFPTPPTSLAIKPPVVDGDTILLGLNPTSSKLQATLADVWGWATGAPPPAALGIMQLEIDPAQKPDSTQRNAVWFTPGLNYQTTVRLHFDIVDSGGVQDWLRGLFSSTINVTDSYVIARKQARADFAGHASYRGSITFGVTLQFGTSGIVMTGIFTVDAASTTVMLICDSNTSLATYRSLLGTLSNLPSVPSVEDWLEPIMNKITPKRLQIGFGQGGTAKATNFSIDLEVDLAVGKSGSNIASALFTLSWTPASGFALNGSLWTGKSLEGPPYHADVLAPDPTSPDGLLQLPKAFVAGYEEYNDLVPPTSSSSTLRLDSLIPGLKFDNAPPMLNLDVFAASFSISEDGISFYGALKSDTKDQTTPCAQLGMLALNASHSSTATSLNLEVRVVLSGNTTVQYTGSGAMPAELSGQLTYDSQGNTWAISANIHGLNIGTLYEFFDADSRDGVLAALGSVYINTLTLNYQYAQAGNTFSFTGDVLLCGVIELQLKYKYKNNGTWTITASLSSTPSLDDLKSLNVQQLVSEFNTNIQLPDFVGSIPLSADSFSLSFNAQKANKNLVLPTIFAVVELTIGGFDIVFAQCVPKGPATPKTVFRATVSKLPDISDAPIVKTLTQPFDEMYFLHVTDANVAAPGLTLGEVETLNSMLSASVPFIYKQTQALETTGVIIAPGMHFVIAMNVQGTPTCILDYSFSSEGTTLSKSASDPGLTMASMQKTYGPVTISSIGLQFKDDVLSIHFDASVKLGPLQMDVIGFMIGVDLNNHTLANLPPPEPFIDGLAVSYNCPPTTIAGSLACYSSGDTKYYAGGVQIGFAPYEFIAAGCYGSLPATKQDLGNDGFKTVAVFGRLNGPLVELEFAEISGITGGFGYNSLLNMPTVDNVTQHPFVGDNTTPGADALSTFASWTTGTNSGWVSPMLDSKWFAIGLKVLAFQALSVDAVVVVDTEPDVSLAIFGSCVAQFPPKPGEGDQIFVNVELGIVATINYNAGTFLAQGKLSPRSFIFDTNCHLTGGFALGYWFGQSAHAGDWVFTIGGYHPAFSVPSHYPAPDRLQISWVLDSSLSIIGQAYLAITPKTCMAGGDLQVTLTLGNLCAAFHCWADLLLNYQPFFFTADAGVTVSVQYTLDLWITTLHIDIHIGATLNLAGPPTHGSAYVDFWVFGFTVAFGSSSSLPPKLTLAQFYEHILLQDTSAKADNPHTMTCVSGLVPSSNTGSGDVPIETAWTVRAGDFSFRIKSPVACSQLIVNGGPYAQGPETIYSQPMHLSDAVTDQLGSIIKVQIQAPAGITQGDWRVVEVANNLPTAIWGPYSADEDPTVSGNNIHSLLDPSSPTMTLMMGAEISAPTPNFAHDQIPAFNVTAATVDSVASYSQCPLLASDAAWIGDGVTGEKQWNNVQQYWLSPMLQPDAIAQVVDAWVGGLNWDKTNGAGFSLSGHPPKILLQTEGKFEQDYLAAPLVSVG